MDNEGGSGIKKTEYSFDGTTWNTYSTPFAISKEGTTTVYYRSTDNAGNVEITKSTSVKIDKTTPTIPSVVATPNILWPPNHKMVDVRINGSATDDMSGIASVVITVTDEYGIYNMTVPEFGSTIQLEAWREGADKNGRVYTITVIVTDIAGNQSIAITRIVVPHDIRK